MGTFGTKIRDIDDFELYIQKFQLLNFSILSGWPAPNVWSVVNYLYIDGFSHDS